jgi:predicted dehydrogenase
MIDLGFIGVGGMGTHQADCFRLVTGCRIAAAADPSEETLHTFTQKYSDCRAYGNHRDLLKDPAVDAVVIAVPTGFHSHVTIDAMKAGKPTLVEKPMARTVAQCRKMLEASARQNTFLMVAHCRRYDPNWGAMAKVVRQGRLGRPVLWRSVTAGIGPANPWFMDDKLGGGPLLDGAVHNYDFANLVFGDPESVLCSGIKLDETCTAVDTGSATVRYRSGDQMLASWSWAARGLGMQDVVGPKAFLQFGPGNLKTPSDNGSYSYHCVTDRLGDAKLVRFAEKPAAMMKNQCRHFLQCVHGKATCKTPGEEAIKAVAVGEAILNAAAKGQTRQVKW